MFAKFVFVIASLALAAECAPPSLVLKNVERKCMPLQWEGIGLGKVAQVVKGQAQVYDVLAKFSTDYAKKREAFTEAVYRDGKFVLALQLIRTKTKSYIIYPHTKRCISIPKFPIYRLCSDSPHINLVASMSIGNQMADTYSVNIFGRKFTITMFRKSFLPVSEVVEQRVINIPQMVAFQFGNITKGIKDPSVFDVPSYCKT